MIKLQTGLQAKKGVDGFGGGGRQLRLLIYIFDNVTRLLGLCDGRNESTFPYEIRKRPGEEFNKIFPCTEGKYFWNASKLSFSVSKIVL
jgi:hypothetical protein